MSMQVDSCSRLSDYLDWVRINSTPSSIFRGQGVPDDPVPRLARSTAIPDIERKERKNFEDLRRLSVHTFRDAGYEVKTDWDRLIVLQHFGCDTRLLDWTPNALIALWFAVSSSDSEPTVFKLNPPGDWRIDADKDQSESVPWIGRSNFGVLYPSYVVDRVRAQRGCFTVHPVAADQKSFQPVNRNQVVAIEKCRIHVSRRSDWFTQLEHCGVNAATVFPDLVGLAQHANDRMSWIP